MSESLSWQIARELHHAWAEMQAKKEAAERERAEAINACRMLAADILASRDCGEPIDSIARRHGMTKSRADGIERTARRARTWERALWGEG